jgi:hypothetical protein
MTSKYRFRIKLKFWISNILFCFLISHGCGSELDSNRSRKNKEARSDDENNSDNADKKTDGDNSKNPGGPQSADQPKGQDVEIDESTLPPYLFRRNEFQKIKKIVDPYKPVSSASIPSMRNSANLVRLIESTINEAMKMPVHAPGRKFKVSIVDSKSMNAFMTGDSRMGLNLGTIQKSDNNEILAVICHEMAHSARNHIYQSSQEEDVRLPSKLVNRLNSYIGAQFDRNRATYTHDEEGYVPLRKEWDEAISEVETSAKKAESEADLIGAKICGNMGMDTQMYEKSLISFLKKASGNARPLKLRDGSTFTGASPKAVFQALFPIIEHPTNEERGEQISRLKSLLKTSTSDQNQKLYESWLAEVQEPLDEARGKSLSLTGHDGPLLWMRDEKTGEIINLDLPFGGCSHGNRDMHSLISNP